MKIYRIAVQVPIDPNNPDAASQKNNAANAIQQLQALENMRAAAAGVNDSIDQLSDVMGTDLSELKQTVSNKLAEILPQTEAYKDVYNNVEFNVQDIFDDSQFANIKRQMTEVNNEVQTGEQAQIHR